MTMIDFKARRHRPPNKYAELKSLLGAFDMETGNNAILAIAIYAGENPELLESQNARSSAST